MILRFWDSGITNKILSQLSLDVGFKENQCRIDDKPKTKVAVLKLVDLAAAFFLIGIGLTSATLVFVLEITVSYGKRRSTV